MLQKLEFACGKLQLLGEALGCSPSRHKGVDKFGGAIAGAVSHWLDVGRQEFGEQLNACAYGDDKSPEHGHLPPQTMERLARYFGFGSERDIGLFASCDLAVLRGELDKRRAKWGKLSPLIANQSNPVGLVIEKADSENRVGVLFATVSAFETQAGPLMPVLQAHLSSLTVLKGVVFGFSSARVLVQPRRDGAKLTERWLKESQNGGFVENGVVFACEGTDEIPQWDLRPEDTNTILRLRSAELGPLGVFSNAKEGDVWDFKLLIDPTQSSLVFEDEDSVLPEDKTEIIENFISGHLLTNTEDTKELREESGFNLLCATTICLKQAGGDDGTDEHA